MLLWLPCVCDPRTQNTAAIIFLFENVCLNFLCLFGTNSTDALSPVMILSKIHLPLPGNIKAEPILWDCEHQPIVLVLTVHRTCGNPVSL